MMALAIRKPCVGNPTERKPWWEDGVWGRRGALPVYYASPLFPLTAPSTLYLALPPTHTPLYKASCPYEGSLCTQTPPFICMAPQAPLLFSGSPFYIMVSLYKKVPSAIFLVQQALFPPLLWEGDLPRPALPSGTAGALPIPAFR